MEKPLRITGNTEHFIYIINDDLYCDYYRLRNIFLHLTKNVKQSNGFIFYCERDDINNLKTIVSLVLSSRLKGV